MPRHIPVDQVREAVEKTIRNSAFQLPDDYLRSLATAQERELSPTGRMVIGMLRQNADIAESEGIPTCQDTGMAVLFLEVGQDVHFVDGDINQALKEGVRAGYATLRKSVVVDPLLRGNSGDNTPPAVHFELVPGDRLKITVMMKGFGAEIMSRLRMLPSSAGVEGVKQFVVDTVERAGPNACPPVIVGVGLGGTFDTVALLAKKALLRPIGQVNPLAHLAQLEAELLSSINALGIGPQGLGGTVTALAVHIEHYATHIASIPVAVNLNCSAPRRAATVL